jgi:multiple sugar transport system substrate-binding protein
METDIPPQPVVTPTPPSAMPATVAPPPPPPAPSMTQINTNSSNGRGGGNKKILVIALLLLLLGVVGMGIVAILPKLHTSLQPATLTWWGLWEDESVVAPLIDEYQKAHPNVKIKYVSQSKEDYRERLNSAIAQKQAPDIFRFHNSWVPMLSRDLDPMPSSVMSPSDYTKTFYPTVSSDLSNKSSFVGIPLDFDTIALFINQDIFDTYGKQPPETWDDLRTLAKELTIKDDRGVITQSGASLGRTENVDHWPEILALLMLQNGVTLSSPKGKLAEAAVDFYTRFSRVDGVWDETLPTSTVAFAGGKVAMYFGPSWRIHEIKRLNPNLRFKVVKVPQLPKDRPTDPNIYYASYWVEGVWNESKSKIAAWDFLKFLSTKESLTKFYQNASKLRAFGEPYPRVDMQDLLINDPLVGTFVSQGKEAKSWYLQSKTYDGQSGINSQIVKYFEDAVNSVSKGASPESVLGAVATGVTQVLSQYGIRVSQSAQ